MYYLDKKKQTYTDTVLVDMRVDCYHAVLDYILKKADSILFTTYLEEKEISAHSIQASKSEIVSASNMPYFKTGIDAHSMECLHRRQHLIINWGGGGLKRYLIDDFRIEAAGKPLLEVTNHEFCAEIDVNLYEELLPILKSDLQTAKHKILRDNLAKRYRTQTDIQRIYKDLDEMHNYCCSDGYNFNEFKRATAPFSNRNLYPVIKELNLLNVFSDEIICTTNNEISINQKIFDEEYEALWQLIEIEYYDEIKPIIPVLW